MAVSINNTDVAVVTDNRTTLADRATTESPKDQLANVPMGGAEPAAPAVQPLRRALGHR